MSVNKPIVVKIDGKLAKKRNESQEIGENVIREELAATEESSTSNIHTFAREYDISQLHSGESRKRSNFHIFKPILIAIVSATVIGAIMGFVMLKMIVNFDNGLNGSPAILIPDDGDETENSGNNSNQPLPSQNTSLQSMSAFVLQGGVFSTVDNAQIESERFAKLGYTPVIWKQDDQYFLFINLGLSKGDLQRDIDILSENEIEVYAREWNTSGYNVQLTEEEYQWLSTFQENWNKDLRNGNIDETSWNNLIENAPEQSDVLKELIPNLNGHIDRINDTEHTQVLLSLWKMYDAYFSDNRMSLE